jgi:hypothetical protein
MVVMFVDCCVGGGRYFLYYSYNRNPTGWEFFVPAGTLLVVKLLKKRQWHSTGSFLLQQAKLDSSKVLLIHASNTNGKGEDWSL